MFLRIENFIIGCLTAASASLLAMITAISKIAPPLHHLAGANVGEMKLLASFCPDRLLVLSTKLYYEGTEMV